MSRFPYPGYPIAPPLLRPILNVELPRAFVRLKDHFSVLADLDETAWEYVDQSIADILGNLVITQAGNSRCASFWRLTYFPRFAEAVRLNDIQLEAPTHECLSEAFKRELPNGLRSLVQYTLHSALSEIPNFGIRPLVDLLTSAHFHIAQDSATAGASDRLDLIQIRRIIRKPSSWHEFSRKYFPILPKTASLEDLRLPVRAQNCIQVLIRESIISDLAGLSRLSLGQVMERANFGVKSLIVLLTVLQPLVVDYSSMMDADVGNERPSPSPSPTLPLSCVASSNQLSIEDVRRITNGLGSLDLFLERRIPDIPPATDLADMRLDVRTYHCISSLIEGGIIVKPSDLSRMSLKKLMRTKNFGRKSLANLLRSIDELRCRRPSADSSLSVVEPSATLRFRYPDLTQAAEKLVQSRVASRVRCNDPRLSDFCGDLLYTANNSGDYSPLDPKASVQQVALRLAACTFTPEVASEVKNAIRWLRAEMANLMRMKLEVELRSLAATQLSNRNLEIVLNFSGWGGELPKTLQSVGDSFGITRERVRQIVSKFEKIRARRKAFLPRLERVLRFVSWRVPSLADDVEKDLQTRGLTTSPFRVESIIECAKLFGQPVAFVVEESAGARVVTEAKGTGLTRLITGRARRTVSKYGLANVFDIRDELAGTIHAGIDLKFLSNVIRSIPSSEDLGDGWFWVRDVPRNHLITLVSKVLAVAPRIHVSEIRAAIADDLRGMGFAPPKQAVLRFCQSAANCDIEDEVIVARQKPNPFQVLSPTEQVILDVFRAHGPILSLADLEDRCVERGVKRNTTNLYAGRLAIVARYAPGLYGLRGASFSADDLDRAAPRRQTRYSDHGWTEKAEPWAAIELTASVLSSGVIQLPFGFRQQTRGRYILRTEDRQRIGQLVVADNAAWGLSPLFRRRGGEPGDILVLTFDLRHHEVAATIGDLAVVPEPSVLAEEVVD